MDRVEIKKAKGIRGEIVLPPDKSISHRAVMFASIAEGKSIVRNFLAAEDPLSTLKAMKMLGAGINEARSQKSEVRSNSELRTPKSELIIHGSGLHGLKEPFDVIYCGNSGTTIRLLSGILAGNPFFSVLTGDDSLKQRPMARITTPLKEMGARISGRDKDRYPPIAITGGKLKAMDYKMPVASAQVKSCLILAGLYADGITTVTEPQKSRDHTERMLKSMGASIDVKDTLIKVDGRGGGYKKLEPLDITIPADFSSAAFFIVAALLINDSEITIKGVGINPTRTGLISILKRMGADVRVENIHEVSGEPVADIFCRGRYELKAVNIMKEEIPLLIDEFPILCIAATQADGVTKISGAEELRFKESDRIKTMATELKKLGVELEEHPDGISIRGKTILKGHAVESYGDHRIAMSLSIAGLLAEGTTVINNASCVDISFPGFFEKLDNLKQR